jgi:uncharacterized protein YndB with AHSA1/START domain
MKTPGAADTSGTKSFTVSRVYPARRDLVFKAWSSAEHVRNWFTPPGLSTPHVEVEMRVGGPFVICMQMPNGLQHWTRGTVVQVTLNEHLAIDMRVTDAAGRLLFRAYTDVTFSEVVGGTRLDVVQTYSELTPEAEMAIAGAPQGWAGTLDNLGAEIKRIQGV